MYLRKIDFLSPKLTLYFFKQSSHSNFINGIITIITLIIYLVALAYFSLDIIYRTNGTAYLYNRIIDDAGIFSMKDSIFHYINIINKIPNQRLIQIYGLSNIQLNKINDDGKRENFDHYIYSFCTEDMKKYIKKEITEIIDNKIYFNFSFCIESFYNSTSKEIVKYNEKDFIYPTISSGMSNPNRTYYGIIAQKCVNSTLNNFACESPEKIEKFISGINFDFRVINYDVDIKNYKKPLIYSFISVTSGFSPSAFSANYLNFQPLSIISNDGLFLNSKWEKNIYKYEQNEKQTWENINGILGAYYFWLQNNAITYERNYKKIQNMLSDFGGISHTFYMIAYLFNYIIYKFSMLNDINKLLHHIIHLKKGNSLIYNIKMDYLPNSSSLNLNMINKSSQKFIKKFSNAQSDINFNRTNCYSSEIKSINNLFEIKKNIKFSRIDFFSFFKWIIQCRNSKNSKIKQFSYLLDTYKKFISEESIFYIALSIKDLSKLKHFGEPKNFEKSLVFI